MRAALGSKELDELGLFIPRTQLLNVLKPVVWNNGFDQRINRHSVLLFGLKGCGEDALMEDLLEHCSNTSIHYLNVQDLLVKIPRQEEAECEIKRVFRKAETCQPALIILNCLDSICESPVVSTLIQKEMESLDFTNPSSKVFCIGHASAPWMMGEDLLQVFKSKIFVPPPTQNSCKMFLQLQLKGVILYYQSAPQCLDNKAFEELAEMAYAKVLTWNELQGATLLAYKYAYRNALSIDRHKDVHEMTDPRKLKPQERKRIVILKEDLVNAVHALNIPPNRKDVIQKFYKFVANQNVKIYETQSEDAVDCGSGSNSMKETFITTYESTVDWIVGCCC